VFTAPFAGIPTSTVYGLTVSGVAADGEEMARRCRAAFNEKKRMNMIRGASSSISLGEIEAMQTAADTAHHAHTQQMLQTNELKTAASMGRMRPTASETMGALAETFAREPKHRLPAGVLTEFFSAGSADGPNPGARSEQGMVAAGAYYLTQKPSKFIMIPGIRKFQEDGRKYLNHNLMG
jgi:hypothetical protein